MSVWTVRLTDQETARFEELARAAKTTRPELLRRWLVDPKRSEAPTPRRSARRRGKASTADPSVPTPAPASGAPEPRTEPSAEETAQTGVPGPGPSPTPPNCPVCSHATHGAQCAFGIGGRRCACQYGGF